MPILSSTAASSTEPAVGAVVWAGGSQVCTGKTGTLTAEAGDEQRRDERLGADGYAVPAALGEDVEVGGAGLGDEGEDADEHQGRAERGVEDEPVPRRRPARARVVGVAEPADEHPHRHEHELEGDEEEHGVAGVEGGQRAELDEEQAGVEGRRGAALRAAGPGVCSDDPDAEDRREQQRAAR